MTYDDAEHLASLASNTPEALPEASHRVLHLCRNWQTICEALAHCDIGRTDGRVVLTLAEGVTLRDLYEIDVL
jgi:hypothetical protein